MVVLLPPDERGARLPLFQPNARPPLMRCVPRWRKAFVRDALGLSKGFHSRSRATLIPRAPGQCGMDVPQTPTSPRWQHAHGGPPLYGGLCWNLNGSRTALPPLESRRARPLLAHVATLGAIGSRGSVENSVQGEDEAALRRLRHAIAAEDEEGEQEQLKGVLRMLEERSPTRLSSPRFVGEHRLHSPDK